MYRKIEKSLVIKCLQLLVRPVVKYCLRHSVRLQDLVECCKTIFVEVAEEDIKKAQGEVTTSRISVMTGMHRRDVKRILENVTKFDDQAGLVMRVVGRWRTDHAFITKGKKPRVLTFGTEDSEFNELVSRISKDLNPATVLFELERVNAIEKTSKGLKLVIESYVPKGNVEDGFRILSQDAEDLIDSVEENVLEVNDIPNLHARTEYDTIRPEHIPDIRRWLIREGHLLHQRARNYISQFDQDINPDPNFKGDGAKVIFGTFSKMSEAD